jgi:hypothetical protein
MASLQFEGRTQEGGGIYLGIFLKRFLQTGYHEMFESPCQTQCFDQ